MANPHPDTHPKMPPPRKAGFPWPWIAIIVAILILAAVFWFIPRPSAMRAAQQPPQTGPANSNVRLEISHMQPAPAPAGKTQTVSIDGQLYNVGGSPLRDVVLQGTFRDSSGKVVLQQTSSAQKLDLGSNPGDKNPQPIADNPIAPGATSAFRVQFTEIPPSWNKQQPEIKVAGVQFAPAQQPSRPNPADIKR